MVDKILTANNLPHALLEALYAIGLPRHPIRATISIEACRPVEITATFYATEPPEIEDSLYVEHTKRYRLVEFDADAPGVEVQGLS